MNVSTSKLLATCAATVLLAVALSACGGGSGSGPITDGDDMMPGDGDGMKPVDPPSPQALANAVDLVANDSRQDANQEYIGGNWYRSHDIGNGPNAAVTMTHSQGEYVNAIVSHDSNDTLQHNVALFDNVLAQETDPSARFGRYINTQEEPGELVGVTSSARSVSDHGLGLEWQVTELTNDYDAGGTLTIYVATDVQPSDNSMDPFESSSEAARNITLAGAPALAADRDFIVAWIDDGDSIDGSLDGVAGTFSCANAESCAFLDDHGQGDYYSVSTGAACKTLIDSERRKNTQASNDVRARQLVRF